MLENDVMTDLGTLENDYGSEANGLNDSGIIVGMSWSNNFHAFRYENGVMTDLGTLGGLNGQAFAVNNSGLIVGEAYIDDLNSHAFLWENGLMINLGTIGGDYNRSVAYAINTPGQIVGRA
jgi:probable HAF family extracellular repeat protein